MYRNFDVFELPRGIGEKIGQTVAHSGEVLIRNYGGENREKVLGLWEFPGFRHI